MSSNNTTPKLRFTGERLIPGETDPDLFNEHFARYVYARMFCSGKIVLDTGCGVGYGSLYLAECARCVAAVDIPSTLRMLTCHTGLGGWVGDACWQWRAR